MPLNKLIQRASRILAVAAFAFGLTAGNATAADYVIPGTIGTSPTVMTNFVGAGSFLDNIQFTLGADGAEILGRLLGMAPDEVQRLADDGVI